MAQTMATSPRQNFISLALPELLHAVAAGLGFSDLAARVVTALVDQGVPGACLMQDEHALLGRAGRDGEGPTHRFLAEDLSLDLLHDEDQGESSLRPLAMRSLDLLLIALRQPATSPRNRSTSVPIKVQAPQAPPGNDAGVRERYRQAAVVAGSRLNVLVEGESGTGKEQSARYLHGVAGLPESRFIALNCAALPRDLLDAELFGIEAGVATGVTARAGCFEQARAALDCLEHHERPGNVRELEREMLGGALFLNDDEIVDSGLLKPEVRGARLAATDGSLEHQLAIRERRIIRGVLAALDGNVVRAAEKLGVGKSTLYRRLGELGIESGPATNGVPG